MRDVDSRFWNALTTEILPMRELKELDPFLDTSRLFNDLAGAILECLLRELRGAHIAQRDLMAQVRSAKYHKVKRFAAMIQQAYADTA